MKRFFTIIILISTAIIAVNAQSNLYKIDDRLYDMYKEAEANVHNTEGLRLSKKMFDEAVKNGDKKAQCIALAVQVKHYGIDAKNKSLFDKTVENMKQLAKVFGYTQYYYFALRMDILHDIAQNRMFQALRKAETMHKEAISDNNSYGIYYSLKNLGNIYSHRRNNKLALESFKKAFDYHVANLPDQDLGDITRPYTECLIKEKYYSEAENICTRTIKETKSDDSKMLAMFDRAKIYFLQKDKRKFDKEYSNITARQNKLILAKNYTGKANELEAYRNLLEGNTDEALKYAERILRPDVKLNMLLEISKQRNDWKQAYKYHTRLNRFNDSTFYTIHDNDIAEINAQMGYDKLQNEKMKVEMQNAMFEQQRLQQKILAEKEHAEKQKIMLENAELEAQKMKANISMHESEKVMHQMFNEQQIMKFEADKNRTRTKVLLSGVAIMILIVFIIYLLNRRRLREKTLKVLQAKNKELVIARNEAEAANNMKTKFIQNMSHEIRTPLNSIVGFSQLLLQQEMELSDKEKAKFGVIINNNTELLMTLINDILKISELESNNYQLTFAKHKCNEMMAMAVNTVIHRKPENVKLYFTSEVDDDYEFVTDAKRLDQVFINMLTNAEKYTEQGEIRLHCSTTENPGKLTFSVTDTGVGIPPEDAEAIFDRFKKLDDFKQGVGLGLNICRLIAEKLSGEIFVDTAYTQGARFVLVLPTDIQPTATPAN